MFFKSYINLKVHDSILSTIICRLLTCFIFNLLCFGSYSGLYIEGCPSSSRFNNLVYDGKCHVIIISEV